jgi:hypothetical protein
MDRVLLCFDAPASLIADAGQAECPRWARSPVKAVVARAGITVAAGVWAGSILFTLISGWFV